MSGVVVACGEPGEDLLPCPARLLPGDLVITEIMANARPASVEWIELHNATGVAVDLTGVVLSAGAEHASTMNTHRIAAGASAPIVQPGEYWVSAPGTLDTAPEFVRYGYGDDLADLADELGRVAVRCDVIEVDTVTYGASSPGVTHSLTAAVPPDYLVNDEPARWCSPAAEFSPGSFGTPGRANDCKDGAAGGTCNDRGTRRSTAPPAPGDLIITEIMANPAAVSDSVGEWIELWARTDLDLNGVTLARQPDGEAEQIVLSDDCISVAAGGYAVLARARDSTVNGGLPGVDHSLAPSLGNSEGYLELGVGEVLLDAVSWSSAPAGRSLALDPDFFDARANDTRAYWCADDSNVYGMGDGGTPGRDNRQCAIVIPGMCDDGAGLRPSVPPGPGQAVITEYMANPDGVSDTSGEWIEVRFDADVDLNGLQLGREPGSVLTTLEHTECLRVAAGTHVLFGHDPAPANNGGLPPVAALFDYSLVNSGGGLFVGFNDDVLDSLTYESSSAGASTSLDESDGATWCSNHTDGYGDDPNSGTPGRANPPCPAE